MESKFAFELDLPPYANRERKAKFINFILDTQQKIMTLDFDIYYRATGDTEWPDELINSVTSLQKNLVSGQYNFSAGSRLTLKVTNTTFVNPNTGSIIVNPQEGETVIGEYDFFQSILCNFTVATGMLQSTFPSESFYGLHQFALLSLYRAIAQGRLD
jgi:hypothetical protein